MEEQDTCVKGGDSNGIEKLHKAEHQEKQDLEAGEVRNKGEEESDGVTDDSKVDEGIGKDLSESSEVSGDENPVIEEHTTEESSEVQESECVVEEEKEEQVNLNGDEVQEVGKEESADGTLNETEEQAQEQLENHTENHINGTSTKEETNHSEPEEEERKEPEENGEHKDQESGDTVDLGRNIHEDDSHHSISELKSKWDSFGKEQNSPPINHVHCKKDRDTSPSDMADTAKSSRFGGTPEKCNQCNKTVYAMERLEVAGRLMHKTCFRCSKCNSPLSVGRFSVGGGELYCMTHYKQAFREKGTYDVFTPDNPIKGKWQSKPAE